MKRDYDVSRIKMNDLDTKGGIAKLEHDGFNRHQVWKAFHYKTEGASAAETRELAKKLFNRQEPC